MNCPSCDKQGRRAWMVGMPWPNGYVDRRGNRLPYNYSHRCLCCDLEFPSLQELAEKSPAPPVAKSAVVRADQPEQLQLFDTRDHITFR